MIISHKYKFIFLKTLKTAGTSIEIALSRFCDEKDIITPIAEEDEAIRHEYGYRGPQNYFVPYQYYTLNDWKRRVFEKKKCCFYNHAPARHVHRWIGDQKWNTYYKFSFDRNPWDKVVSLYYYVLALKNLEMTFPEFLQRRQEFIESYSLLFSNYSIYSLNGTIAVDYLGRYENMEEDLDKISKTIGLPESLMLPRAKGNFRKSKRPYQEYYGEKEKAIIADICRKEIDLLGYVFE